MATMLDAISNFILKVGFPTFVAVVLLYNQREMHRANLKLIRRLAEEVAKMRKTMRKNGE